MSGQNKYYLEIPYALKDLARENKCLWDTNKKKWYTCDGKHALLDDYEIVNLSKFKYDDKDIIKSNGGKFDATTKTWYTYASNKELERYF